MPMSFWLLIQAPTEQDDCGVRGLFTTPDKAKNHDPALKGRWETGPGQGQWSVGEPGAADHHIIKLYHPNEEIEF